MTVKATNQIPADAYELAKREMIEIKNKAQKYSTLFSSDSLFTDVFQCLRFLDEASENLNSFKDVAGLAAYAQDQEGDGTYNPVTEFNSLIALIDDAEAWIVANIPKDGNDYILVYKIASNALSPRTFTIAQLSTLVTKLNSIDAFIE